MRWFANSEMLNLHSMKFGMTGLQVIQRNIVEEKKNKKRKPRKKKVIPPGFEPGTLSVLDSRDNHYTTESDRTSASQVTILAYSGDIHLYTEV